LTGKTRGAVFAAAAGFLLLCALLPLAFSGEEQPPEGPGATEMSQPVPSLPAYAPAELDDRARLFDAYWNGGGVGIVKTDFTAEDIISGSADGGQSISSCQDFIHRLMDDFNIDQSMDRVQASGINYFSIADSSGTSIRVAEGYREWYGDWKNWLRIFVDIDTQDVYFIYLSSICRSNFELYPYIDAVTMVQTFGDRLGYELMGFVDDEKYAEEGKENWAVVYRDGDTCRAYRLHGSTYYDPAASSQLVDYTMTAIPYEGQINVEEQTGMSASSYNS